MRPPYHFALALVLLTPTWATAVTPPPSAADWCDVPAGNYLPLESGKSVPSAPRTPVPVPAFRLERTPVTNAQFLEFVRANPRWRRDAISPLFADEGYLAHWAAPLELGAAAPADAPVVRVSWFAARAYAAWRGGRLPSESEWERAAAVCLPGDAATLEARQAAWSRAQLAWFSAPGDRPLTTVGRAPANALGLHDLHTLVWEWVDDFSASFPIADARDPSAPNGALVCGAGAMGVRDPRDYAAFMRAGFRSSLRARFTVPNLGFRCAADPSTP